MKCVYDTPPRSFEQKNIVVACFVQYRNEILLLKRQTNKPHAKKWGLPAGKQMHCESALQAMIRETSEETGYTLLGPKFIKKFYVRHEDNDFIYLLFHKEITHKAEVILNSKEHTEHAWVPVNHAHTFDLIPGLAENIEFFYTDNYHLKYWKPDDLHRLSQVKTFEQMAEIGLTIIERMPQPLVQICGPISTGGAGSIKKNLERFKIATVNLESQHIPIFRQAVFEDKTAELIALRGLKNGYCYDTLELFYRPLFESGLIKSLYFLPDWQSSLGTKWERKFAEDNNHIDIYDLSEDIFD